MKILKPVLIVTIITLLISCGNSTSKESPDKKGFSALEQNIKNEFGKDAYFTDLTITYNKAIGNIIGVTVTKEPASLKMEQWNSTKGNWTQNSEITLEVPQGTEAADFMFQLGEKINLSKLGELVQTSIKTLKDEKNIENPILQMAAINFPENGDIVKTEYLVMLQPENGGTTFTFQYRLNGNLIEMNY